MKEQLVIFAKSAKDSLSKHSPEILTGLGIAGMVTTTILAVGATPKALQIMEMEREYREENCEDPTLTKRDTIKLTWKYYIPAALTGAASIACLIGASTVNLKRNAALTAAYKLSEDALTTYRKKVIETIGEKKEKAVKDKVDQEYIDKNPVSKNEVIITGRGETLCYDVSSGRYFKSDIEALKRIENELNKRMLNENYISLSDFYDEIGLRHTNNSDYLGWNINMEGFIDFNFGSQIADDGTPCVVIDYRIAPRYDFDKLM